MRGKSDLLYRAVRHRPLVGLFYNRRKLFLSKIEDYDPSRLERRVHIVIETRRELLKRVARRKKCFRRMIVDPWWFAEVTDRSCVTDRGTWRKCDSHMRTANEATPRNRGWREMNTLEASCTPGVNCLSSHWKGGHCATKLWSIERLSAMPVIVERGPTAVVVQAVQGYGSDCVSILF